MKIKKDVRKIERKSREVNGKNVFTVHPINYFVIVDKDVYLNKWMQMMSMLLYMMI